MKKGLSILLSLVFLISLCACGAPKQDEPNNTAEGSTSGEMVEDDKATKYIEAEKYEAQNDYADAAIAFGKIIGYSDAYERSIDNWERTNKYNTIAVSSNHTVAVKNDGTVVATGSNAQGQCDLSDWSDIIAVAAGPGITVGLKSDHTVISSKKDLDIAGWKNIVDIAVSSQSVIGVSADGTIVHTALYDGGDELLNDDFLNERLADVISVDADARSTTLIALTSEGSVVCDSSQDQYGQCKVGLWSGRIISVDAGTCVTAGVLSTGHVEIAGLEGSQAKSSVTIVKNSVDTWRDIIDVAVGYDHIICLKSDGTTDAVSLSEIASEVENFNNSSKGESKVQNWSNIVDIVACDHISIGLRLDGTVVAAGDNSEGACDVGTWTDIRLPM